VGYPLKQAVAAFLQSQGAEVVDVGPDTTEHPVDYPDYAFAVDRLVASGACERGILVCGTGLGMSIAANKFPGIRAALCDDAFLARLSRAHNDANVLCLGVNVTTPNRAEWIVQTWLSTPFDHGRHIPRLDKLDMAFQSQPEPSAVTSTSARANASLTWERFSVALSLKPTVFAPVLFAGRLEEGLAAVEQAGFRHIEISLRDPQDIQAGQLADLLSRHNLSLTAIATGQSCLHDRLCLASPEAELSLRTGERLKAFIEMAQHLGSGVIIGGVRGRMVGSEVEMQVQRQRAVEVIKDCAGFAQGKGVPLWLEPINRYETNFVNSSGEGAALLEEVGAPNFKLLLDTFHMNIEEPAIPTSIRLAADRLGYIHFADSNRQAPGNGHVDFKGILKALDDIGYQGIISTECLPLPDDRTALQRISAFFRATIEEFQGATENP
jgi:RpiB/LacA/LacB family sugar-phosphate isomerase